MKFRTVDISSAAQVYADVLLVGCHEDGVGYCLNTALGTECGAAATRQAQAMGFTGALEQSFIFFPDSRVNAKLVVVYGLGVGHKLDAPALRKALAVAFKEAKKLKAATVSVAQLHWAGSLAYGEIVTTCAGLIDYVPNHYKTGRAGQKPETHVKELVVGVDPNHLAHVKSGLKSGRICADAVNLARDLSNEPANILTPRKLADEALKVAAKSGGTIEAKILGRRELKRLGANAILAVSQGSSQEPYLIELTYTPPTGATAEVLGFVGKSVTFDSGGLDIKGADGMRTMKRDMSGGAVVLAAIKAVAALELPISVKAVMAATENMPDGKAYKPGDVIVKTLAGLSVEVDNTDAEGRLTLADAIEYAKRRGVTRVIDLATLTGSVREFGGDVMAGAFGNDAEFTEKVLAAAGRSGELVGVLPMANELRSANHTDIADLKNSGGSPGSVTAAWFLREFAGETPWVHLDIAGVSYRTRELGLDPKYATGFGVRTLVELARAYSS
jgi:leucyl aminopeptidase